MSGIKPCTKCPEYKKLMYYLDKWNCSKSNNHIVMKTVRYQFLSIVAVFILGLFSRPFSDTENGDDVYYQDKPDSLNSINLDCDTLYNWSMLFWKKALTYACWSFLRVDELFWFH